MDFIEINGAGLRYELTGEGTRTLVLLHEMAGSLESWDAVVPLLRAGRRVLRYDWRGAGMSERQNGALSLDVLTDDLFALLGALGLEGDVALCGTAVGGAIALNAAARRAPQVKAVIATSPATGYDPARRPDVLVIADSIEAEGMRGRMEASMTSVYPPVLRTDPAAFARYRARWLGTDPQSYAAAYRMLAHLDLGPVLPRIAIPALVLAGEHDTIRPVAVVREVAAKIPGARLQAVASGHIMAMQTPRIVADAILDFLKPLDL